MFNWRIRDGEKPPLQLCRCMSWRCKPLVSFDVFNFIFFQKILASLNVEEFYMKPENSYRRRSKLVVLVTCSKHYIFLFIKPFFVIITFRIILTWLWTLSKINSFVDRSFKHLYYTFTMHHDTLTTFWKPWIF